METIQSDVVIIGAGLTGLATAYFLRDSQLKVSIVEARDRIGGRIHTKYDPSLAAQEMGATWLGKKHQELIRLLETLEIGVFEQALGKLAVYEPISTSPHQIVQLPPNTDPSFRIQGGTTRLINTLADNLEEGQLHTSQVIKSIEADEEGISVQSATHCFRGTKVISTLPPYLLLKTIAISPALPTELTAVIKQTHTWMGESIKVSLTYAKPFWRAANSSGTIFSNVGPIPEMYDHSNYEDNAFALKGFFNGSYFSVSKAERLEMVLKQLRKYFGAQADDFLSYEETVWRKEAFTFIPYESHVLPHQNNGHPIYRNTFLDGKLLIAGSETAASFPGYMDGAVTSARFAVSMLTVG